MANSVCDVAVIGGGVIGLACAWRLAEGGARVHLFERAQIGREASHAAAGMLAAQCEAAVHPPASGSESHARERFFRFCLQSRALYPSFAAELHKASEIDIELSVQSSPFSDWRRPGILYIPTREDDRAQNPRSVVSRLLKQNESGLRVEETLFNGKPAFWLPGEGQVDNRKLVAALHLACVRAGVILHENSPIDNIAQAQKFAPKVLLCSGAWSSLIAPELASGVYPIAGEVLSLRSKERLENTLYSRDVYLVPRRDGRVLVGATMAERGFDKSVSTQAREALLASAARLFPAVQNWPIEEHWAGLRPASADGLPLLGESSQKNVFVATGHFRNGVLLTPLTAQIMSDSILNGSETPEEFSPLRFAPILKTDAF